MKLPQLHIRDLFWLVALVAMALGWWLDHSRWAKYGTEWETRARQLEYQHDVCRADLERALLVAENLTRMWSRGVEVRDSESP